MTRSNTLLNWSFIDSRNVRGCLIVFGCRGVGWEWGLHALISKGICIG
jgi:hypothetical protein